MRFQFSGQLPWALFRDWVALSNVTAHVSHNGQTKLTGSLLVPPPGRAAFTPQASSPLRLMALSPPQRGQRWPALAQRFGSHGQTRRQHSICCHSPFSIQIWLGLRRTSQQGTQARYTGLGLVGRVLLRVSGKLARPHARTKFRQHFPPCLASPPFCRRV